MKRDCQCPRAQHDHGDYLCYEIDGCRCFPCSLAWSDSRARNRAGGSYAATPRFVPRIGTERRLQALLALGWRHCDITTRLAALGPANAADTAQLLRRPGDYVWAETARAVATVYDELSMTIGPSNRTRTRAIKLGYLPPLAWDDDTLDAIDKKPIYSVNTERDNYKDTNLPGSGDFIDEIAVSEAVAGRPRTLTKAEMTEAMVRLTRMGYGAGQIAERLGTNKRLVGRRRAAARSNTNHGKAA